MQQESFASKTQKPATTRESLPPLLRTSLTKEAAREVCCSEALSGQGEVNYLSTSICESKGEERRLFFSSGSTTDDMSTKTVDIQPPAFPKPSSKRHWACISLDDDQEAETRDSFAGDSNVREVNNSGSPCADWPCHALSEKAGRVFLSSDSAVDDASKKTLDIQPPVLAKPSSRRPWARAVVPDKHEADAVSSERDSNVPQVKVIEIPGAHKSCDALSEHAGRLSWSLDATSDDMIKSLDIQPPSFAKPSSRRPLTGASSYVKRTVDAAESRARDCDAPQVKVTESLGADEGRSNLAMERPAQSYDGQCRSSIEEVSSGSGWPSSANRLTSPSSNGLRSSNVSEFESAPRRQRLVGKRPPQDFNRVALQAKPSDCTKSSKSSRGLGPNLIIYTKDANVSGMKYNLVQFRATPTLSTTYNNKKHKLTRRTSTAKPVEFPRVRFGLDSEAATEGILNMFGGMKRREVKTMLRGTFSAKDVAEVLQVLKEGDQRTPSRGRSRKSSDTSSRMS